MRDKFNHLYLDSHERILLIHSLVELKNQLIQQSRYGILFHLRSEIEKAEGLSIENLSAM